MALIGTLAANIVAKTKGFINPLKKSRKELGKFKKSTKDVTGQLKMLGGAALAAVGVGGLGAFVTTQLKALDSLGKTADKLGLTTEQLGALRYAAGLAGVQANTLDMALQRMSRRIAEAANGSGEAKAALEELGLSAKSLAGAGTLRSFLAIEKSINGIAGNGDKMRLAMRFFDSEGVDLVNMFAAGVGQAAREYKRLGLEVSREDVKRIEEFNDAWSKVSQVVQRLGQQFVIDVAPRAVKFAKDLGDFLKNWQNSAIGGIAEGISREFTSQDGMFKFKERRNPFTGRTSKTTGSILLDTFLHGQGMNNVVRDYNSRNMYQAAPPEVVESHRAQGVYLPQINDSLNRIANNTSGQGGTTVTLEQSDMQ